MKQTRAGLGYGTAAYALWGAFPFFFGLIAIVNPLEVVPLRVATTLLFCAVVVSISRRWSQVIAILRRPKQVAWFALSSLLLYINWQIFVIAVMTGHVIEAALGYFITPLFSIMTGVVVRKEKLSRLQWIAVSIATVGVLAAAIAYGTFPWMALGVATSFGMYGAVRKQTGENVDGLTGLTVETLVAVPLASVQFLLVWLITGLSAHTHGPGIMFLVLLSGVVTAVPLILFGEAARRLPLSYLGFLQFLTPILGFLYGYLIAGESMSLGRWIGFIAVWIALVILIIDMVRHLREAPAQPVPAVVTGPIPLD